MCLSFPVLHIHAWFLRRYSRIHSTTHQGKYKAKTKRDLPTKLGHKLEHARKGKKMTNILEENKSLKVVDSFRSWRLFQKHGSTTNSTHGLEHTAQHVRRRVRCLMT